MCAKKFYKRIAVFDLDGTLWAENSHVYLVEHYYQICGIKKFCFKVRGRLFPKDRMNRLNRLFDAIPQDYIESFAPTYNVEIVQRLEEYKSDGWYVIIITNAPLRIAQFAKRVFGVEVYQTPVSCKGERFSNNFECECLHVISDNKTDIDIIRKADKAIVLTNKKNRNFFAQYVDERITYINK